MLIFLPKWNKRINQEKINKPFEKIFVTINQMINIKVESNPGSKITEPIEP